MKRHLPILLLALAAFAASAAFFAELSPDGSPAAVHPGGKVAWIDGVSTNAGWTPGVKIVREAWETRPVVTDRAFTNHVYVMVVTNGASTVTNTAPRPFRDIPATMKSYATNDVVKTWAETNLVEFLVAAETNSVTAGTTWAAPGDLLFVDPAGPAGARVTVGLTEH